jgi:putative alpha-1,2-mannosidase
VRENRGVQRLFCGAFRSPVPQIGVSSGAHREDGGLVQAGLDGAPGAYIGFAPKDGDVVRVKVGTSFTSVEEARRNLDAEVPGWNLVEVAKRAQVNWNDALSKIEVPDASESRRRVFYTAL